MSLDIIDDEDCYCRLKAGEEGAFRYLIRVYVPVLCHYANKMIMNKVAAEDIVMDTIVKIWEKRDTFQSFGNIKNFFYIAVRNACLNYKRDREREQKKFEVFNEINDDIAVDEIIYAELLMEVRKVIDGLPSKMREIFILSYVQQLNNQAIALQLGLSDQTVRNQKTKALAIIRGKLENMPDIEISLVVLLLLY